MLRDVGRARDRFGITCGLWVVLNVGGFHEIFKFEFTQTSSSRSFGGAFCNIKFILFQKNLVINIETCV